MACGMRFVWFVAQIFMGGGVERRGIGEGMDRRASLCGGSPIQWRRGFVVRHSRRYRAVGGDTSVGAGWWEKDAVTAGPSPGAERNRDRAV